MMIFTFEWARRLHRDTIELNLKIADKTRELQVANVELEKQRTELKKANQMYMDMVGFVSHELKTPITPIRSLASLYLMKNLTNSKVKIEELENCLSIILRSAQEMEFMIEQFLNLSRIEKGELLLHYQNRDLLNEVIRPAIEDLKSHLLEKNMNIIFDPLSNIDGNINDKSTAFRIDTDTRMLKTVFHNLFTNAIKYGQSNSDIIVKLNKVSENRLRCSILNAGEVIQADQRTKIFERFYRIDPKKASNKSSGLGLFITAKIIEKFNGRIWCDSPKEYMNAFHFEIPISENSESQIEQIEGVEQNDEYSA